MQQTMPSIVQGPRLWRRLDHMVRILTSKATQLEPSEEIVVNGVLGRSTDVDVLGLSKYGGIRNGEHCVWRALLAPHKLGPHSLSPGPATWACVVPAA